jgi:hypothetical protein
LKPRRKSLLAGDLNAKHLFWSSTVSNPLGKKLLDLFDVNDFEISAPQSPTHYSTMGNGDVFDIVVHQNVWLSDVILTSWTPITFQSFSTYRIMLQQLIFWTQLKKFTDWERFQNLASDLISPRLQITSRVEGDKVACDFTAYIALAYRLSTSIITL